jgi:hypothetical protein
VYAQGGIIPVGKIRNQGNVNGKGKVGKFSKMQD